MKKMKKLRILIIVILFGFVLCGFGITFSMFRSNFNIKISDQEIASFVFDAKKTNHLDLNLSDIKPGDTVDYTFLVKNNATDSISHVSILYNMTIKTYHFMPLDIELYKIVDEDEEFVMKCDETYSRDSEENYIICNSENQEMPYSRKVNDNYKLRVKFPSEYSDTYYADLVDFISVDIRSSQKTGS